MKNDSSVFTEEHSAVQQLKKSVAKVHTNYKSINSDIFKLYSVADPHKEGAFQCLIDYFMKNRFWENSANNVLEFKISLTYKEYVDKRYSFLNSLDCKHKFIVKMPRMRDKLIPFFKGKAIKEIAYGDSVTVSFYLSALKSGSSSLEFICRGDIRHIVNNVCEGIESVLLTKP